MAKNILVISCDIAETRVALIENGIIAELHIERRGAQPRGGSVGDIYLGKVTRVLPGLQAAFVDIGLERAAFLHVEDLIRPDDFETYLAGGRKHALGAATSNGAAVAVEETPDENDLAAAEAAEGEAPVALESTASLTENIETTGDEIGDAEIEPASSADELPGAGTPPSEPPPPGTIEESADEHEDDELDDAPADEGGDDESGIPRPRANSTRSAKTESRSTWRRHQQTAKPRSKTRPPSCGSTTRKARRRCLRPPKSPSTTSIRLVSGSSTTRRWTTRTCPALP